VDRLVNSTVFRSSDKTEHSPKAHMQGVYEEFQHRRFPVSAFKALASLRPTRRHVRSHFVSDIAVSVLKRDVKLQLTHSRKITTAMRVHSGVWPNDAWAWRPRRSEWRRRTRSTAASQLVTWPSRHTINSSHGQLVTLQQWTRHATKFRQVCLTSGIFKIR